MFGDELTQECAKCPRTCTKCTSWDTCSDCIDGFALNTVG